MSALTRIKSWITRNADHNGLRFLEGPGDAAKANEHYVRIWLSDMFIAHDRELFTDRYPMVHSTINLSYAGSQSSFVAVARAPVGQLGPAERRNYPLTPLLPWRGGIVEVEAGLSALPGKNLLAPVLDALSGMSKLLAPPLSSALAISSQIGVAVDGLLKASQEPIHLGLHESFAASGGGARELRPGHLIVARCTTAELEAAELAVVDGALHRRAASRSEPFSGADYMLIECNVSPERDDWRFPALDQMISQAQAAIIVDGDQSAFARYRDAALTTILTSPDLTPLDRRRISRAVRDDLAQLEGAGQGAVGVEPAGLETIVATRAATLSDARAFPDLTLEELVAGH